MEVLTKEAIYKKSCIPQARHIKEKYFNSNNLPYSKEATELEGTSRMDPHTRQNNR